MRFVIFRTPKPKSFSYKPRYYDPKREEWERKKAEKGLQSKLSHHEELRLQMSKRWRKDELTPDNRLVSKILLYAFYTIFIGGSIYLILFTDFIEKLLAAFGIVNK